ncbi:Piso0_003315 [Millerozyma farinosa CBS 7064]|uniref:Piso0_003315 protein n=1 Tax=Pichia sorbitophila (strain ATCC MYA-4447 / BCRC 22081 / CBS 7064 / NBRC 10061 / NRRL Y-12695) TaxID=559304 RepID=G8YIR8_PICSO|nr:Piso0_003315 [Millerozyma farinosa CBS 7064]CCE80978.1 Piso0_003315 [Millerozyma farinosa CBS 7064]
MDPDGSLVEAWLNGGPARSMTHSHEWRVRSAVRSAVQLRITQVSYIGSGEDGETAAKRITKLHSLNCRSRSTPVTITLLQTLTSSAQSQGHRGVVGLWTSVAPFVSLDPK